MAFYKRSGDHLLTAVNSVIGPNVEIYAANKDQYTFPVDGWYWFDTLDEAMANLKIDSPDEVTIRQARLALNEQGQLAQVETAISNLTEPQKTQVMIEWEYTSMVVRGNPLVDMISNELGLTEVELDELFALAKTFG